MNSAWLCSPILFRSRLLSFSILGLSLFSANSYTSEVYVWKDTQGNLHFSDFPEHKDAKRIELPDAPPPPQVLNESDVDWTSSSLTDKEDKSSSALPLSVSIRSPQHDATIRSNAGVIDVIAELTPNLRTDQQLQLLLDGSPVMPPQSNPKWRLNNIDRGTHTLTLQVLQSGKVIASSDTITVHLHRASVQ